MTLRDAFSTVLNMALAGGIVCLSYPILKANDMGLMGTLMMAGAMIAAMALNMTIWYIILNRVTWLDKEAIDEN